jgi:glycerol-3-phosphate acyltransferase PlsY
MYYLAVLISVLLGYLSGGVSYARIFTRLGTGKDITQIGNGNPGTSNVMRQAGKGWGMLTFLSDILKGSLIMMLVKVLFFSSAPVFDIVPPFSGAGYLAVMLTGIAAIYGHAYPLYYRFRGGGSIAVLFGCWSYLIYPQFFLCAALAWLLVKLFLSRISYPLARTTPIVFIIMTPLFLLGESLFSDTWRALHPDSLLFDHIGIGNHFQMFDGNGWLLIAGILLYAVSVIITNLRLLKNEILVKQTKTT